MSEKYSVQAELSAVDKGFTQGMEQAAQAVQSMADQVASVTRQMEGMSTTIGQSIDFITKSMGQVPPATDNIKAGASGTAKAFDGVTQTLGTMASAGVAGMATIGKATSGVGRSLTGRVTKPAIGATGALLGLAGWGGLKGMQSLDTAQARLRGLGYQGKSLTGIMDQVSGAVEGTSFWIHEMADVAAIALQSGVKEGAELERRLKAVGAVASATGEPIDDIAHILNKVGIEGKLAGMEIMQLSKRGVNAVSLLAKEFNKTEQEIMDMQKAGEITADMLEQAFVNQLGDVSIEMAKTFSEAFQIMTSQVGKLGQAFWSAGKKMGNTFDTTGGAFGALRELMIEVYHDLVDLEGVAGRWGAHFQTVIEGVTDAYRFLRDAIKGSTEDQRSMALTVAGVAVAMGPLLQAVGGLFTGLSKVAGPFEAVTGLMAKLSAKAIKAGPELTVLGFAFSTTAITATAMGVSFYAVLAIIGIFTAGIALLAAGLGLLPESVRSNISQMLSAIQAFVPVASAYFVDLFLTELPSIMQDGFDLLAQIADTLSTVFDGLSDVIRAFLLSALEAFRSNGGAWMEAGVNLMLSFIDGIISNLDLILAVGLTAVLHFVIAIIKAIPQIIAMGAQLVRALITGVLGADWGSLGSALMSGIKGWMGRAVDKGKEEAGRLPNEVNPEIDRTVEGANESMSHLEIGEIMGKEMSELVGTVGEVAPTIPEPLRETYEEMKSDVSIAGGLLGEGFTSMMDDANTTVSEGSAPLPEPVVEALNAMNEQVSISGEEFTTGFTDMYTSANEETAMGSEAIQATTAEMAQGISEQVGLLGEDVPLTFATMNDLTTEQMTLLNEQAQMITAETVDGVTEQYALLPDGVLVPLGETFLQAGETLGQFADSAPLITQTGTDGVRAAFQGMEQGIGMSSLLSQLHTSMATESILASLQGASTAFQANQGTVAGSAGAYQGFSGGVTSSMLQASNITQSSMTGISNSVTTGTQAATTASTAGMTQMATATQTNMTQMSTTTQSNMTRMSTNIQTSMTRMSTTVQSNMTRMASTIQSNMSRIASNIRQTMTQSNSAVTSGMSQMTSRTQSGMNQISTAVSNGMNRSASSVRGGVSQMNSAFSSGMSQMTSRARSAVNTVANTFASLRGRLYSAGRSAGAGAASGISSMQGAVASAARALANAANSAYRSTLNIKSPSRVMIDAGEETGLGAVIGISNMIEPMKKASVKLAESAVPDFHKANVEMAEFSRSINTDISVGERRIDVDVKPRDDNSELYDRLGSIEEAILSGHTITMDKRAVGYTLKDVMDESLGHNQRLRGRHA